MPFTSLHYSRDVKMVEMAHEIHLKCRRIDPQAFLDKFLPMQFPGRPKVTPSAFEKIAKKKTEVEMYKPLVCCLIISSPGI